MDITTLKGKPPRTRREVDNAITENVRKLVRNLSEPGTSVKKLRKMEDTVLKILTKQRWAWVPTGAEMKSSLDDLAERFRLEGMPSFGDTIKEMAHKYLAINEIQQHPHPYDGGPMLEFLLIIANNPVQYIRRNRAFMEQQRLSMIESIEADERQSQVKLEVAVNSAETEVDWAALLAEDFLDPPDDDSSESLSDWSEESDCDSTTTLQADENVGTSRSLPDMAMVYKKAIKAAGPIENRNNTYMPPVPEHRVIKSNIFRIAQPSVLSLNNYEGNHLRRSKLLQLPPPQPPQATTPYWQSDSNADVLLRKIHAYWWRPDIHLNALPSSTNALDNFAVSYVQFLNSNARGLLALPLPKTTTESCLLREILLMFVRPSSCCFFIFNKETRRITVRENVSICTVTARTLQNFLLLNVVPALEDMFEVQRIIEAHTVHDDGMKTTITLECFAYGLRDLVRPISQLLIAYEERVIEDPATNTLINLTIEFREHFRQLRLLRLLAEDVILDKGPPHLRSAYLLSRLYKQTMPQVPHQKLAIALLLFTLRIYCSIIDGWWRRATLEDRLDEFIVEICIEEDAKPRSYVRKRSVNCEESLEVVEIFNKLQSCPLYQILLEHALESGETQDLLSSVNKLGEMLTTNNESQPPSLHDELVAQIFTQIAVYCGRVHTDEEDEPEPEEDIEQSHDDLIASNVQGIKNLDLFAIFTQPVQQRRLERQRDRLRKKPVQLVNILKRLERSTCLQLKSELPEALGAILQKRQCLANEYAMQAYCKDLHLAENVRFVRHTMMLEAYYILVPHYTALFARIERNGDWARSSVLTSTLCAVLSPYYPQLANRLHVAVISQINSNSSKVYEALEAMELDYKMPVAMQRILTAKHMKDYNLVWRLMLKVKWAVWKLETLEFLRRDTANPYAPLDLLGLTIRRLEIVRFWMIFLINNLHTHIMQAVGEQFELRIGKCKNIRQLRIMHDEHLSWLKKHCMLTDEFKAFRVALEQLFHLIYVLDMEWNTCACYMGVNDALCLDFTLSDDGIDDGESERRSFEYLALNQVAEIEVTYIRCHQTLADILNTLVYQNDHRFLSALEETISSSMPH
ncbi:gamma-tubulin complex component 5 [Drosophila yakuba]|uniref:Gamma-tubulin complex component n=1 Tax=Drosophila yakuba TaxID=7245 RepID=B4PWN4_DROYA|nr:gamma-tubulin complex component 5 [Drosophila yakuba]EDX01780.1 uncharacterized protein Dyak_GE16044 [Drosophila yakuba]